MMKTTNATYNVVPARGMLVREKSLSLYQPNSFIMHAIVWGLAVLVGIGLIVDQADSVYVAESGLTHYEEELTRIDRDLQAKIDIAAQRPDSWLHLESVAKAYIARARLTGEFDDYHDSATVMDKVFTLSGAEGGPVLTRASLNFAIHRLPAIEADLIQAESALLVDASTTATIQGLRADVLFYTALYSQAKNAYDQLESSFPSVTSATRLANYNAHVGEFVEAERWFDKAEQRVTGQSAHLRSWLKLQLGILDLARGRLDEALVHYRNGLEIFPGFWLLEEHIAEIDALQGRDEEAEKKYRDLVQRTGSPVFMSALAEVLAARANKADQEEAIGLRERINRVYESRIEKIPELMSGHALEYFLQSGNARRALQLAQFNYKLRPGGEAALQLVQAHTALGQLSEATALLESLLTSPYRSADLNATAGVVYRANGDAQRADEHDALARKVNPMAVDDMEWLRASRG